MPVLVLDEGMNRAESMLALPLKTRNRALGALMLTGRRGTFDAATNRVLGILSNQAAAALSTLQLLERIKSQAVRDGLTGLYNRRAFDDLLMRAMAREERQAGRLALLLLDLDHFKKLNDTYGHPAGDAALRITAQILERHLRKADQAARFGGEEFVAILPGTDETGAQRLAERMREALVKHTFIFEGARIALSASFGVAIAPADGAEPEALLAAADRALYAAKQAGRNRVVTSSSLGEQKTAEQTGRWQETDLR
jgi:diguanylate cyclase (GGDEF)-like protein